MGNERIMQLSTEWREVTNEVLEFKHPGLERIQRLFKDTYGVLSEYRNDSLVPKEISGMLIEMHNFGWWVTDLNETPLHSLYQPIVSLVCNLNSFFLTPVKNEDKIESMLYDGIWITQ